MKRMKVPTVLIRQTSFALVVLVGLILAAYWPVKKSGFVGFDDNLYVVNNRQVQSGLSWAGVVWAFTTTEAANWHPLTWLSHAADVHFYGLNPEGHHLTNVLIHVLNTLLLYWVLCKATRHSLRSLLVAALFGLHPLNVESVAWVAERKNVLTLFFGLLSLGTYVGYAQKGGWLRYLGSVGFFALGLMAKPMIVTLPCLMLLMDFWPLERLGGLAFSKRDHSKNRSSSRGAADKKMKHRSTTVTAGVQVLRSPLQLTLEKLPFFLLTILSSAVTVWAQGRYGAVQSMEFFSLPMRLMNACVSYTRYLSKLFWPTDLTVFYPHPGNTLPAWQAPAAAFLLAAISAFAVWRARRSPYIMVGWFWFVGSLVPMVGLVQVGDQAMADRYAYLPMIGIIVLLVWSLCDGAPRVAPSSWVIPGLALVSLCLAIQTHRQLDHWRTNRTLYEHMLNVSPNNYVALTGMGLVFSEEGQLDEAAGHFYRAIEIKPHYTWARESIAGVENNRGVLRARQGKHTEALAHYLRAVEYQSANAEFHYNLALCYVELRRWPEASDQYRQAIERDPRHFRAHRDLGSLLYEQGKTEEALAHYQQAIQIQPDAQAYFNIGAVFANEGKPQEAIRYVAEALRLQPGMTQARDVLQRLTGRVTPDTQR